MLDPDKLSKIARFRAEAEQLEHSLDVFRKEYTETLPHHTAMLLMSAAQSAAAASSVLLGLEWGEEDAARE